MAKIKQKKNTDLSNNKKKLHKSIIDQSHEVDFGQLHRLESSKINNYSYISNYPECKAKTYSTPPLRSKRLRAKKSEAGAEPVDKKTFHVHNLNLFELKLKKMNEPLPVNDQYNCAVGFRMGKTASGTFFKQIVCGKEFCQTCGSDYSISHVRRIVRVLPKVMQLKNVGYMVITIPSDLREKFKSKIVLNDFRSFIKRKLKRGYSQLITVNGKNHYQQRCQVERAFMRWHWCGSDGSTYKPHLNILIDKTYLDNFFLSLMKRDVSNWLKTYFKLEYNPLENVYYGYSSNTSLQGQRKVKHWINYITRSTATNLSDLDSLETIHGYRNISYIGKFEKTKVDSTSRGASIINNGIDCETGEKIIWGAFLKPKSFFTYYKHQAIDLGCGIYYVLDS